MQTPTDLPVKTVAQLLLDYLKAEGVSKVFGIPGGAVVWVMNELKKQSRDIDYVICRHETGAAYMADGFSRVGRGLGVVLVTSGPGATNALTGAMNAQASNSALLVITGEVPEKYFGQGYLQEGADAKLDIGNVYQNAVQSSDMISNQSNFQTLIQQALRNARSLPYRAAHISLPNDIAGTALQSYPAEVRPASYRTRAACTDAKAVAATLHELVHAQRPLVFLGNGCREAMGSAARLAAFTRFVEHFGIPVMTTPNAKGIFPETHALSLRNYGICGSAWPQLYMKPPTDPDHFDVMVVLGSTLGELSTSVVASDLYSRTLSPRQAFVQVDLDAGVIGRDFAITRGVVAEIGATLDELCAQAEGLTPDHHAVAQRRQAIADIKRDHAPWADPAGRDSDSAPVHPAALMRVINDAVHESHLFIDAGNCVGWSLNNLVVDPPLRYQSALAMGPMGFAVAAVIGAKLAAPELPCVAIVGDGAFMMHGAEISTAAQNGVGAVWVVLNDNDLAMVSQGMGQLLPPAADWVDYYQLGQPDLVKFAQGLGAEAVAIGEDEGASAVAAALANALASAQSSRRPQVIVVHIDTRPAPPYGWPKLTT
ncbi:MAG: thiamine pyrophosphate-binding protein [Rubrivivax sp.]|nr:MAG: thiamine pyrophosphate-binding protein [Rubrivivax sp.]